MADPLPSPSLKRRSSDVPQRERFFRYFQQEITDLQEQMGRLGDTALVGGERTDAVEHLLAGIARVGSEVNNAASYLPAYDQKTYGEVVKGLREKLDETRAAFAPRAKFSFKTARKNPSAVSLSDAAELAAQKRRNLPGYQTPSSGSSFVNTPNHHRTPDRGGSPALPPVPPPTAVDPSSKGAPDTADKESSSRDNHLDDQTTAIRRPTFSTSSTVSISRESKAHIILPSSTSHASKPCSLTSLKGCVVDLSVLSPQGGTPFAGLTVKNVKGSLLVCGHVSGPAHITAVEDSVIVVTCRQFRMHECRNVDLYLSCSSQPVIENCEGIRFARLPEIYRVASTTPSTESSPLQEITNTAKNYEGDLSTQIQDFNHPNASPQSPSPNWSFLPQRDVVPDEAWKEIVPGGPGRSVEDILRAIRIRR